MIFSTNRSILALIRYILHSNEYNFNPPKVYVSLILHQNHMLNIGGHFPVNTVPPLSVTLFQAFQAAHETQSIKLYVWPWRQDAYMQTLASKADPIDNYVPIPKLEWKQIETSFADHLFSSLASSAIIQRPMSYTRSNMLQNQLVHAWLLLLQSFRVIQKRRTMWKMSL